MTPFELLTDLEHEDQYGLPDRNEQPVTAGHAVQFILLELNSRNLTPPCDISWLLAENRRRQWSPSAQQRGVRRGNRDKWGRVPVVRMGARVGYYRTQLTRWMDAELVPKCEQGRRTSN